MAPSQVKVVVEGSKYIVEKGIPALLEGILQKLEETQPADPARGLLDAVVEALAPTSSRVICSGAEARARAKAAEAGTKPGDAIVPCVGDRQFPVARGDTALVLIDMQTDFLSPEGRIGQHYKTSPVRNGISACERLLASCRRAGLTIAHSRSHRYGATVRDDLVGTDDVGYELFPSLRALPGEIVVDKWTFGAFASTPLEERLRERGVERILLCGVLTNVCVFATASQAVDRFFRVCLVEDACAAFQQEWHDKAVALISEPQTKRGHNAQVGLYFGEVTETKDVESALASMGQPAKL
mmetsp:Transcript_116359/g.329152  ORF Transcript_116359/g.329152 Transcript_116359/m.329152 type:complete len:298 (+) Transcript_116359:117-1010(+)